MLDAAVATGPGGDADLLPAPHDAGAPDSAGAQSATSDAKVAVAEVERGLYPPLPGLPTQRGPDGLSYDFNVGVRVHLPARPSGVWRVRFSDLDTGNTLFETKGQGALARSAKSYFVRARIEVWEVPEQGAELLVLSHDYDAADRDVLIAIPAGTLGDTLAWLPYAIRFWQASGCRLTIALGAPLIPLLQGTYPHIRFLTHAQVTAELADSFYATYWLGLFFRDTDCLMQPTDFRHVGLHRTAAYILGVDPAEEPLRLALPDSSRPIDEPYVCIAVQSSSQCKMWNNPFGWHAVIAFLKQRGYRVVCIDQRPVYGQGLVWNHIPHGVEDETGDRPLAERARWLRHAAAFVGLSSGLSWLAWSMATPVVMISGFTHPTNEFTTPYRVINWHACNSCWNDPRHQFDHNDFLWCPRQKDTARQFECTRLITAEQVIAALKRIPTLPDLSQRG